MRSRFNALAWCALAALGLGACAREIPLPPERRALAADPLARFETRALDLGTPAARSALWSGWGPDEKSDTATFAWGGGERSLLLFEVFEPRSLTLRLRGWAYPFADGLGVEVTVRVNDRDLSRVPVPPQPSTIEVEIPGELVRAGENRLELVYARHHAVAGESPWAVAWDGIRFLDGDARATSSPSPSGAPAFDAASGAVELSAGSALEWSLVPAAGAVLAWDAVRDEGDAALRIEVANDGTPRESRRVRGGPGRLALDRELRGHDAASPGVRLRLAATGGAGSVQVEGLRLHVPRPAAPTAVVEVAAAAPRPNLVVYLIDTLRADRLGCYGYGRATSPHIDRFAREAVLFREARAQSSWTRPAVTTLLSGLAPWVHGVEERSSSVPAALDTLPERLARAGYETAIFTTNANIVPRLGFGEGWSEFRGLFDRVGRSRRHLSSAEMHPHVVDWLDRRDPAKPFLLFVHTLDPHDPYRPAEKFRARLAPGVDVEANCCGGPLELAALGREGSERRARAASELYDAEVAENDESFGALLDELERRGLATNTAVLLTSDHGEEFFEHGGWKHGFTLYEEQLRVPLVLRLPGRRGAGQVVEAPAEQIDVLPTLLELAALERDPSLPGTSLLTALVPGTRTVGRARSLSTARLVRAGVVLESAKAGSLKLIRRRGAWIAPLGEAPFQLFDLAADARELRDLALARPFDRRGMEVELDAAFRPTKGALAAETTTLDPELDAALKALGYL